MESNGRCIVLAAQLGRLQLSGFRDAARSVEDPKRGEIAMLVVAEHDAALTSLSAAATRFRTKLKGSACDSRRSS
jgi:hypothetical protein